MNGQLFDFERDGIQVTVEIDTVEARGFAFLGTEEFDLIRVVASFDIFKVDLPDKHKELVPIKIKVKYSEEDFTAAAKRGYPLRLGIWIEAKQGWIRLKYREHQFKLVPEGPFTGYGEAVIDVAGDPMVGWGS